MTPAFGLVAPILAVAARQGSHRNDQLRDCQLHDGDLRPGRQSAVGDVKSDQPAANLRDLSHRGQFGDNTRRTPAEFKRYPTVALWKTIPGELE